MQTDRKPNRDDQLSEVAGFIRAIVGNAWDAVLCGSPNPVQEALHARMLNYKRGDLVVELSTLYMQDRDLDAVGRLVLVANEPIDYPEWEEEEDGPRPMERVFYIDTLDGRRFRWTNARFLAAPIENMMAARWLVKKAES